MESEDAISNVRTYLKIFQHEPREAEDEAKKKPNKCDACFKYASERNTNPKPESCHAVVLGVMNTGGFTLLVVIFTLLALFLADLNVLAMPKSSDDGVSVVLFLCFIFFLTEITASAIWINGYFLSFFFWCDILGTASLITDIPWMAAGMGFNSSGVVVLRAGRVARSGTRATRVLRLLRTFRLIRMVRALNSDKMSQTNDSMSTTKVAAKLQTVVSQRVILLVVIMMVVLPLLDVTETDHAPAFGLDCMEIGLNSTQFDPLVANYFRNMNRLVYVSVGKFFLVHSGVDGGPGKLPWPHQYLSGIPDLSSFRDVELDYTDSSSGLSQAVYDIRDRRSLQSLFNILITIFIVALFGVGSLMFTHDAEMLFFRPISRMISGIKRLASILFNFGSDDQVDDLDETLLIEAVVSKMGEMFRVRLEKDGVRRRTTTLTTPTSVWRIRIEEHEVIPAELAAANDANTNSNTSQLMTVEHLEELSSLPHLLESPICCRFFSVFLQREYAVENLLFIEEVRSFKLAMEQAEFYARQIFDFFISTDAVNQVNCDDRARCEVENALRQSQVDLFAPVEKQILALLNQSFPRFIKSTQCEHLVRYLSPGHSDRKRDTRRLHRFVTGSQDAPVARITPAGHPLVIARPTGATYSPFAPLPSAAAAATATAAATGTSTFTNTNLSASVGISIGVAIPRTTANPNPGISGSSSAAALNAGLGVGSGTGTARSVGGAAGAGSTGASSSSSGVTKPGAEGEQSSPSLAGDAGPDGMPSPVVREFKKNYRDSIFQRAITDPAPAREAFELAPPSPSLSPLDSIDPDLEAAALTLGDRDSGRDRDRDRDGASLARPAAATTTTTTTTSVPVIELDSLIVGVGVSGSSAGAAAAAEDSKKAPVPVPVIDVDRLPGRVPASTDATATDAVTVDPLPVSASVSASVSAFSLVSGKPPDGRRAISRGRGPSASLQ